MTHRKLWARSWFSRILSVLFNPSWHQKSSWTSSFFPRRCLIHPAARGDEPPCVRSVKKQQFKRIFIHISVLGKREQREAKLGRRSGTGWRVFARLIPGFVLSQQVSVCRMRKEGERGGCVSSWDADPPATSSGASKAWKHWNLFQSSPDLLSTYPFWSPLSRLLQIELNGRMTV